MTDARHESNSLGMELIDCIELPVLVVDRDLTLVSFNRSGGQAIVPDGLGPWQAVAVDSDAHRSQES